MDNGAHVYRHLMRQFAHRQATTQPNRSFRFSHWFADEYVINFTRRQALVQPERPPVILT